MGKVDPAHQDLTVDPLGILRPITKLTHQLPLVPLHNDCWICTYQNLCSYIYWFIFLALYIRLVLTRPLPELGLVLDWSREEKWILLPMNPSLQTALVILLELMIIYSIQVLLSSSFNSTIFIFLDWFWSDIHYGDLLNSMKLDHNLLYPCSWFLNRGVSVGAGGWGEFAERYCSSISWVVIGSHSTLSWIPLQI